MSGRPRREPVAPWPPTAGWYAARLTKGGPRVPVRIWYGPPQLDGETLDRSERWCVEIDGRTDRPTKDGPRELLDVEQVWPHCAREPIDEVEYRFLLAHASWLRAHDPAHPKTRPYRAVDFLTLRPRLRRP